MTIDATDQSAGAATEHDESRLAELLSRLSLEEKVQLLTGRNFWTTWPVEKIGLRRMLFSDGPSGVRGEVWDEREPSLNLPSATALSSGWDPQLAHRYGAAAAVEARRKGVDVVLGPTINLHRSPLGGRHFEAFSEDPVLTSELAAAYVRGMQANGVAATPKHYVANDSETDRFTVDARVAERPLRELYLLAFERAVVEAHAWLIMSAYNSINGVTASENDLLQTPLKTDWGFDGVVISDWTAVRSLASAAAAQDLAMPGPAGAWGDALVDAVRDGRIAEGMVDAKVLRILRLAARVGALEGFQPAVAEPVLVEDGIAFVREAAAAGTVLLTNNGELPWEGRPPASVAVIGHNAALARSQGGGSATVLPDRVVSPLEGIREALPSSQVTYSIGAIVQEGVAPLPLDRLTNPATGGPGVRARFLDRDGAELFAEDRLSTALVWFGGDAPIGAAATLELEASYLPTESGELRLGFAAAGTARIFVNDELVLDASLSAEGGDFAAAFLAPPSTSAPVSVTADVSVRIRVEADVPHDEAGLGDAMSFTFGAEPTAEDPDALIADAVEAATSAEVAVVVVGTNSRVESEGYDRSTLDLPGRQDDLVHAVAAANPRTVVVVNSGSPVVMPWRDDVAALLVGYFGAQEFGPAIADVLTGAAEPGGRLPTTWPAAEADVPVLNTTPTDGVLDYAEGINIGYRAWLKSGATPAFPFGHGLGYTSITVDSADAPASVAAGDAFDIEVGVTNAGTRVGKQVVQVYAERADSAVERPARWLVGFAPVRVPAGESARVTVSVPTRLLAYWQDGWQYEAGEYALRIGTSVTELPVALSVELQV